MHVHMMSAPGGGGCPPKADSSSDKLRECDSYMWEGVKKSDNVADVICKWNLMEYTVQVKHTWCMKEVSFYYIPNNTWPNTSDNI